MCNHIFMNSDKEPIIKKKSNHSWISFSILLIIVNLLFGLIDLFTFLLPLAIIDFIAVRSYIKKRSPPWKAFLISLLALNVIFFLTAGWTYSQTAGGVAGFFLLPFELILLLIDSIAISSYIYMRLPHRRAKVIFYVALVSIVLGLLAFSVFYSTHP